MKPVHGQLRAILSGLAVFVWCDKVYSDLLKRVCASRARGRGE